MDMTDRVDDLGKSDFQIQSRDDIEEGLECSHLELVDIDVQAEEAAQE